MKNTALTIAGIIFSVVAILHFVRYFKKWEVMVAHFNVPLHWSIYGGIIIALLAIWMFIAAAKK